MNRPHCIGTDRIRRNSLGNPKISHFDLTISGYHDILRFNISMYDTCRMCCPDTIAHLNCNTNDFFMGKLSLLFNIFF